MSFWVCIALLVTCAEAHNAGLCVSASAEQPGYVTLWYATNHGLGHFHTGVATLTAASGTTTTASFGTDVCVITTLAYEQFTVYELTAWMEHCNEQQNMAQNGINVFPVGSVVSCYDREGGVHGGHDLFRSYGGGLSGPVGELFTWYPVVVEAPEGGLHTMSVSPTTSRLMNGRGIAPNTINVPNATCGRPPASEVDNIASQSCSDSEVHLIYERCAIECAERYEVEGELVCLGDADGAEWSSTVSCVPVAPVVPSADPVTVPDCDRILDNGTGDISWGKGRCFDCGDWFTWDTDECWRIECNGMVELRWTFYKMYYMDGGIRVSTDAEGEVMLVGVRRDRLETYNTVTRYQGPLVIDVSKNRVQEALQGFYVKYSCTPFSTSTPQTPTPETSPPSTPSPPPAGLNVCSSDMDCRTGTVDGLDPASTCVSGLCTCQTDGYAHASEWLRLCVEMTQTVQLRFVVRYAAGRLSFWTEKTQEEFKETMGEALGTVTSISAIPLDGLFVVGEVQADLRKLTDFAALKDNMNRGSASRDAAVLSLRDLGPVTSVGVTHREACSVTGAQHTLEHSGVCHALSCVGGSSLVLSEGRYMCEAQSSGRSSRVVLAYVAGAVVGGLCVMVVVGAAVVLRRRRRKPAMHQNEPINHTGKKSPPEHML